MATSKSRGAGPAEVAARSAPPTMQGQQPARPAACAPTSIGTPVPPAREVDASALWRGLHIALPAAGLCGRLGAPSAWAQQRNDRFGAIGCAGSGSEWANRALAAIAQQRASGFVATRWFTDLQQKAVALVVAVEGAHACPRPAGRARPASDAMRRTLLLRMVASPAISPVLPGRSGRSSSSAS